MKKLISFLLATLMLLSLLAGCASKDAGAAEPAQQPAQNETPNENPGEITEISFITWRSEDADVLKAMIADFESKNSGIKVNLEITSSDITEYYTILKSRLVSGEGADVLHVHPGPYQKELADAGYLLDLTTTGLADALDPGVLVAGQVDGKQISLAQTYNSFAIYYNKDLFAELGITEPTDYASLVEACRKSVEAGYMPVSVGFGEAWVTEILYEVLMISHAGGNDNILHDLETGAAKVTDPVYEKIFGDVLKMVEDGVFQDSALGTSYEGSISLFASGKSTMLMDGTWSIGNLLSMNENMNFGLCRIPSATGPIVAPVSPGQGVAINANSKNMEAAQAFVKYLFSVEGEEMYCNGTVQTSVVTGTSLDVPQMDMVSALMDGDTSMWPDVYVENAELLSILDNLCARVAAGGVDLKAELEATQAEIDTMIAG